MAAPDAPKSDAAPIASAPVSATPSLQQFINSPAPGEDPFARVGGKAHLPFGPNSIGPQLSTAEQLRRDPGMPVRDKIRQIENYTQEGRQAHPILATVGDYLKRVYVPSGEVPNDSEHPIAQPVPPPLPGFSGALEGAAADASAARTTVPTAAQAAPSSVSAVPQGPGVLKRAISPSAATQPGAQSALRSGAQAAAKDAGVAVTPNPAEGIRTLMDEPIAQVSKVEDKLYQTLNDAAETDMKDLYDYRVKLQDAIENPQNIANQKALEEKLAEIEKQISVGESNIKAKLPKQGPVLVKEAKATTQQRFAMEDGAKKLFDNEANVTGNVEHGVPETANVDSLIRNVENLDKPSRFAPRGTPTRLQQMFGEEGAKNFKQGLYDAQKAGQTVANRNQILKWAGVSAIPILGGAYELGKVTFHADPISSAPPNVVPDISAKPAPVDWVNEPRVQQGMKDAWMKAQNGEAAGGEEAGFFINGSPSAYSIVPHQQTNQTMAITTSIQPNASAEIHVHPNHGIAEPSDNDRKVADHHKIPVYTLSNRGVYKYDPTTKTTSRLGDLKEFVK